MVISWFFSRNSAGQKRVGRYISTDEKEKLTTKNTLASKVSFRFDGEIKSFTNTQKLREFSTTKQALQQMLEEIL